MRKILMLLAAGITGSLPLTTISASPAAAAGKVNCFGGPHAKKHAKPGDTCLTGALNLDIPRHGESPDTAWDMSSKALKGVRYAILVKNGNKRNANWAMRFSGYVTDSWPFSDPTLDAKYMKCSRGCWAVVEVRWAPRGKLARGGCITAASVAIDQYTTLGFCGKLAQGAGNGRNTLMVWKPGQRIIEVGATNAADAEYCPSAVALENLAVVHNFQAFSQLEHRQQWHFKPLS